MSLLREIQEAATGTEVPLTTVLRKCLVLAARLNHAPLRQWVERELNGYPSTEDLPEYRRGGTVEVAGHFSGFGGSGMKNAPIPTSNVPEEFHENLFTIDFPSAVAEYESLISDGSASLHSPWPADVTAALADRFYEGMNCMQAWKVVSRASFEQVLDAIRNRVLTFVLEIEAEDPNAGEGAAGEQPIPTERVAQIFNTTIYGSVGAMATGSTDVSQQVEQTVVQGDRGSLQRALADLGVPEDERLALDQALTQDLETGVAGEIGPATQSWLDRVGDKIAAGSLPVGQAVTGGVIADAIGKFIGLS